MPKTDDKVDTKIHNGRRAKLRAKFDKNGLENFTETEVLEFALGMVVPRVDTNPTAHRLIDAFGSLEAVVNANPKKLMSVAGIGGQTAQFLHFLREFMIYIADPKRKTQKISSDTEITIALFEIMKLYPIEHFVVLCLDANNRILLCHDVSGGMESVYVKIRDIVDVVMRVNSAKVIFSHNHLEESARPSDDDLNLTRELVDVFYSLGITIIDHAIFSGNELFSFRENGLLTIFMREHAERMISKDYKDILQNCQITPIASVTA